MQFHADVPIWSAWQIHIGRHCRLISENFSVLADSIYAVHAWPVYMEWRVNGPMKGTREFSVAGMTIVWTWVINKIKLVGSTGEWNHFFKATSCFSFLRKFRVWMLELSRWMSVSLLEFYSHLITYIWAEDERSDEQMYLLQDISGQQKGRRVQKAICKYLPLSTVGCRLVLYAWTFSLG
jgi:hypothetical protein